MVAGRQNDVDGEPDTLPKLLVRNAAQFAARVALRKKALGIWQPTSWQKYHDRVRDFSLGLVSLGLQRSEKVAIIGNNRPEWLYSELAAQAAGGISVGLYQDSNLEEIVHIIEHSEAVFVVAENQEQVDKLLEVAGKLPQVRNIIYADPRGMRNYRHPLLISFGGVEHKGRELARLLPAVWMENVNAGKADDIAILCYTSGATGTPKGAMLTHRNLLVTAANLNQADAKRPDDEFVSFLPLAWIGEQIMSVAGSLATGYTVNFPEQPATVMNDLREIGPDVVLAPPRIWESITSSVQVKLMDTTPFNRFMYRICMPAGEKVAEFRLRKQPVPLRWKLARQVAHWVLFRALKDRIGLTHVRSGLTTGSPLGPDVFRFYYALGVPLKQVYGQTEIGGFSCMHARDDVQFHTVGRPLPGTEVKISEAGEILSRSTSVFAGYYKNDAATLEAQADGWLRSGDAGYWTEDGQLVVIDRLADVMKLADGTQFSPQLLENRLKFSPYIKEAVVLGKDRPHVVAMLCIDMQVAGRWAEGKRIPFSGYGELSARPEIYDLVQQELVKVNENLPPAARIRRFVLLPKPLDADDQELTRTRKVRRGFVEQRYADVIAAMYGDSVQASVNFEIKHGDGRTMRIQATLPVREV